MRYTAQSSKYVVKNFFYLFPLAVLPALFLSFSTDEEAIKNVLRAFFAGDIRLWTFPQLFRAVSVLNFATWQAIVAGVVGVFAIIVCISLMMALMEKHMRIGKRTFNGIFSKLNDNLLSTGGYALLLLGIYELWSLLLSALLFLMSLLSSTVAAYVLCVFTFLAMHVILLFSISVIYLWLPCMQITGFRAVEALQYSNQLSSVEKWRISSGQLCILLVAETLVCLCSLYAIDGVTFTLLTTFLYALMIMVYCVRMQIAYFDLDKIERADLKKYYFR